MRANCSSKGVRRGLYANSRKTPPVGDWSHDDGISKLGEGSWPTRCVGMQDTIRVGCGCDLGHGVLREGRIVTISPVEERVDAHESGNLIRF